MESAVKNEYLKRGAFWGGASGIILLTILIIFISAHLEEAKNVLQIISGAKPLWIGLAVLAEIATYVFAGAVWHVIAISAKYKLPFKSLIMLAIEQLSINQLIPAGGVAGTVIIVKAMKRLGLPSVLAMEVLFIDLLSYYIAFSFVTFASLVALFLYNDITPIILTLVSIFFIIEFSITIIIWTIANHKKLNLPNWIKNRKLISKVLESIEHISPERIFSIKLLVKTSLLRLGIFILDVCTLYFAMLSINVEGTFITAFVAVIIASVAGAVTLLPGGIGGFEAGCIGMLIILGVPTESAIASTILFRGISLWVPLIPGLIIARKDLA